MAQSMVGCSMNFPFGNQAWTEGERDRHARQPPGAGAGARALQRARPDRARDLETARVIQTFCTSSQPVHGQGRALLDQGKDAGDKRPLTEGRQGLQLPCSARQVLSHAQDALFGLGG